MTGLDKIISQIQNDAQISADEITANAQREADEIIAQAKNEAGKITKSISEGTTRDIAELDKRSQSAAQLKKRQNILAAKQEIIDNMLEEAKIRLTNLDEKEYFDTLIKIAAKNALPQEGELIFPKKDIDRLPKGFEKAVNEAISESGAKLKISKSTENIDGGFILSYGGMEINCSFKAMFDSARESLQDKVRELLF